MEAGPDCTQSLPAPLVGTDNTHRPRRKKTGTSSRLRDRAPVAYTGGGAMEGSDPPPYPHSAPLPRRTLGSSADTTESPPSSSEWGGSSGRPRRKKTGRQGVRLGIDCPGRVIIGYIPNGQTVDPVWSSCSALPSMALARGGAGEPGGQTQHALPSGQVLDAVWQSCPVALPVPRKGVGAALAAADSGSSVFECAQMPTEGSKATSAIAAAAVAGGGGGAAAAPAAPVETETQHVMNQTSF